MEDMTQYLKEKLEYYVEQEDFAKAKEIMEIINKDVTLQLNEREIDAKDRELDLKERELEIKRDEIYGQVGTGLITSAIGISQLLVDIISLAVHGRWIKMGFGFEATGSISSKTMNKIFLNGKI